MKICHKIASFEFHYLRNKTDLYTLSVFQVVTMLPLICRTVFKKFARNRSSLIYSLLIALLIADNVLLVQCRRSKRSADRQKRRDKELLNDLELENDGVDLFNLIEGEQDFSPGDDPRNFYHDEDHHWNLKRVIRSPLDEDIDEVEDSIDDDDDDEDDEDEKGHKGKEKTTTTAEPPSSEGTTLPMQSSRPSGQQRALANSVSGAPGSTSAASPTPASHPIILSNGTHRIMVNSTTKNLPPGFKPLPPPGAFGKHPPTNGTHHRGPGPLHLPPHGKPGGGPPPFPGKLPPHLLKQLSAPKPPPKKGELYLPEDYNNLVIPKLNLGKLIGIDSYSAVPVLVFLNIRSVRDIDEELETLTLDLDLVIEWVDGFLFDPISAITARQADITLNPIFLKKIWRPDIYIDEIVKVKRTSLMNKPLKLKFNPSNGFISYTTRLTVQLSCDMIYKYYPADTHRCEFTFRSYSYFSKDLELSWLGTGVYLQDPYDPNFDLQVESIDRIKLPQTFRKLTNDTYDGLSFTLLARRKLSFHMVQTYLPSVFFIVITWLCFLVPARMVEARIGISMTTLLTLTSMFSSVRESTPIVSYVKAIDIWMVFCIFFVFLTLLEFATLVWMRSRREDAEEQKLEHQRKMQETRESKSEDNNDFAKTFTRSSSLESTKLRFYENFAELTEKYAFIIFSIVFTIFNAIYWSWLLVTSDYFNWRVNSTLNADVDAD